jgi:nucleotide-binding universal stress UspA family protein
VQVPGEPGGRDPVGLAKSGVAVDVAAIALSYDELGLWNGKGGGELSSLVFPEEMVQHCYREDGGQALAPSITVLNEAGVRYSLNVLVGDVPQTIVRHAQESGSAMICMGTRGMTAISNLVLGSVATKVLHLAEVPVVLVR